MSSITELNIQGIRSFGHEERDRQSIKFFRPLTLITGQNGTGKTTIIECLRYMTTGETPPLSKMIHDPRVAEKTEVKAQVKLSFEDVTRNEVQVTRCHSATKKSDENIQCKAVECSISRVMDDDDDDFQEISRTRSIKIAELNEEMINLLGVSKPILNSVIFCHQEDSNWPLAGEGKPLKTKFDEIFATTRYIKALDNIRQIRRDQESSIKVYEGRKDLLKQNVEKAEQLQDDLQNTQDQLSQAEDSVTRINEELVPIEEGISQINEKLEIVFNGEYKIDRLQVRKKEMVKSLYTLQNSLKKVFKESEEELHRKNKEHQKRMIGKQKDLKQNEKKWHKMNKELEGIQNKQTELSGQKGQLEEKKKQHEDKIGKRNKKIKQAASELNIVDFDDISDESQVEDFMKTLENIAAEQEQGVAKCKEKYEVKQSTVEKEIQDLQDERNNLQHSTERNKSDLEKIAYDLSKMEDRTQRLPALEKDAKKTDKNVQAVTDVGVLKEEIRRLKDERKKKDKTMDKLIQEISTLYISQAKEQINMLKKEKKSKEDLINKIYADRKDEVMKLMGHFPTKKICDKLLKFIEQKSLQVQNVQKELQKLQIGDATCPICRRRFDRQSEIEGNDRQSESEEEGNDPQSEGDDPMSEARRLSSGGIPETAKEKLQKKLTTLQKEERIAIKMQPDIWEMERCQEELKLLKRKIAEQSLQLSETDGNRTIPKVISDMKKLKLKVDLVSSELEQKQQEVEEQTEQDMIARQKNKLQERQQELKREIKKTEKQLKPVKKQLLQKEKKKSQVLKHKEAEVEDLKSKITKLEGKKNEITSLTAEINEYLIGGSKDHLEKCCQNITAQQENLDKKKQEMSELAGSINKTKEELANQENEKHELEGNLELRKKVREEQEVDQEVAAKKQELTKYNTDSLKDERSQLRRKQDKLKDERTRAEGQQDILDQNVRERETQLDEDMYKDAESKYQHLVIELRTTQMAHRDLGKYSKALDEAVMKYHSWKMSEINKIMRDLWQKTYKGNDIDCIQICSDDDTGASLARRKYNYRVVMVKGKVELDMRGRCSAGQKVLASLIIRLALAEAFCFNCGILALDEPTTNLDSENKKSLADALVNIIESREDQRNFQLIVITHDEEFVDLLGRSNHTDYFYRITKNPPQFKSVVEEHSIDIL